MEKIKVAIAGIGNCASSLIQGIEFYKNYEANDDFIPGILHNSFGKYRIKDIEFVAAFDVDENKIDQDLSDAIFTPPNCARKFCDVPKAGVNVKRGPILDSIGDNLKKIIPLNQKRKPVNIANTLKENDAEIVINFLPSGSKKATEYYAQEAIKANCGFINAIPESIATNEKWHKKFKKAGLPLAGDDLKSQLGATILHRTLIDLFIKRGVKIEDTYQVNIGGNTDFYNLSEDLRYRSKIKCKRVAIESLIPYPTKFTITPPSYVDFQGDNKICFIKLSGKNFGLCPISIDMKLSVDDSANAGGVIVDVIRGMKIAKDRGLSGAISDICSYYFKSPPLKCNDTEGYQRVENFIGES